jgi:quercetin dioxygenase-like cupin family protein
MSAETFPPRVLLRSEQSGGAVAVIEMTLEADAAGPPLHHHEFDEAFYVLEGELTFQVGEVLSTARAGELAFAPRRVVHSLANRSGGLARYLLVCTPAGFERELARRAAKQTGVDPPDWAMQPVPQVTVVGPRIGERLGSELCNA